MKKNLLKLSWLLMVALISFTSCNDDDDDDGNPPITVEDGVYLVGEGTALTVADAKGMMKATRNEVVQEERAALLEIYVAVNAGGTFNIVDVAGATTTTYGPGSDYAVVTEDLRDGDEPKVDFWRGSIAETDATFTVTDAGLYHVIFDKELMKVAVAPVVWGAIGAATPGGWGESTVMAASAFDLNTMTFEATDVVLTKADYKFRYSGGWKIILDSELNLGDGKKGVKVNTNYGESLDALVAGGGNISNTEAGLYSITMTWNLGAAQTVAVVKTGNLDLVDYTDTEFGFIGSYIVSGTEMSKGWDVGILLHKPVVVETNYTWTYANVEMMADSTFKIREGVNWDGLSYGYPQVVMAGTAADDFEDAGDGNFKPLSTKTYEFEFSIDAVADVYTLTVKEAGSATFPIWSIIGDATPNGWEDNTMVPNADGSVWTWTGDLVEGVFKFRKDADWTDQIGYDGTDWYFLSGGDADTYAIDAAGVGNYTIVLNSDDAAATTVTKN